MSACSRLWYQIEPGQAQELSHACAFTDPVWALSDFCSSSALFVLKDWVTSFFCLTEFLFINSFRDSVAALDTLINQYCFENAKVGDQVILVQRRRLLLTTKRVISRGTLDLRLTPPKTFSNEMA